MAEKRQIKTYFDVTVSAFFSDFRDIWSKRTTSSTSSTSTMSDNRSLAHAFDNRVMVNKSRADVNTASLVDREVIRKFTYASTMALSAAFVIVGLTRLHSWRYRHIWFISNKFDAVGGRFILVWTYRMCFAKARSHSRSTLSWISHTKSKRENNAAGSWIFWTMLRVLSYLPYAGFAAAKTETRAFNRVLI